VREDDLINVMWMAEDYFVAGDYVEFVEFGSRFAALVWLHRSLSATLTDGIEQLRSLRASGRHLDQRLWGHDAADAGWVGPGEYDLVARESLSVLKDDATLIGGGVVILSATAALESLMTDLLGRSEDEVLRRRAGLRLRRKVAALSERWADHIDQDMLRAHIDWLADRRNAFAHNFIDGEGPWPRILPAGRFDAHEVEEALQRVGHAAQIMQSGCEAHRGAVER
jgi:L-alanine-DL-glutamate epimerase-like enolase superfamily enzyme